MPTRLNTVFLVLAAATLPLSAGSVRDIRRTPAGTLWAVGDGGLILTSDDDGRTWQSRQADASADLHQLWIDEPRVWAIGGRATPAYPGGAGQAVILRSLDGGKTFESLPTGPAGWACGGAASDDSVVLGGQPTPRAPAGVHHTRSGGKRWTAVPLDGLGYLRGAAFRNFGYGYFVGQQHRIVSLRNLMQPTLHPADIDSGVALTAAAFRDAETCWAVGRRGTVVASRPGGQRWAQRSLPYPAGTRSLTHLEAIDFHDGHTCLIGGGLTGVLFRSGDTQRFEALAAPGPGPVRCLRQLSTTDILVGGDGGRIWRSTDAGKTWQLSRGPQRCDVLFIAAAGETSIYPAIVLHAAAGLDVAVVYVTAPRRPGNQAEMGHADIAPGQQLRLAAALAGAGGATVIEELPSLLLDPDADGDANATSILQRWSEELDAPAEPEVLRRLVAAIRLYRPRVVATGAAEPGPPGIAAENRLVARLAARAVTLASDEESFPQLLGAKLPPHAADRLFIGTDDNTDWRPPWQDTIHPARDAAVRIDATRRPDGESDSNIELLAQRAIWAIGAASLLDRPARFGTYRCEQISGRVGLMTDGLVRARRGYALPGKHHDTLGSAAAFKLADARDQTLTLLPQIMQAIRDDPKAATLGADRLLLAWVRLRQRGRFGESEEARQLFMRVGQAHPWYDRMNVATLAEWASSEFALQRLRLGTGVDVTPADLARAAERFEDLHPWADSPAGRLLASHANAAARRDAVAFAALQQLAAEPYPDDWRELALREQALRRGRPGNRDRGLWMDATPAGPDGRIDGKLNEPAWQQAKPTPLQTAEAGADEATVQVVRTPVDVVLGLRLRMPKGRRWNVMVAVDADRDAWTQLVLEFSESGDRRETLRTRYMPPALLPEVKRPPPPGPIGSWAIRAGRTPPSTAFAIQAPREPTDGWQTFEIALPVHQVQDPRRGGVWAIQIIATADDATKKTRLFLRPQGDARLRPERYAMLIVPRPVVP